MGRLGQKAWNKTAIDMGKLRAEYLARKSVTEIAKEYGVTVQTIYARFKSLGITRTNSEAHIGQRAWNHKGGSIDQMGYRLVHVAGKQVREHRVVAEQMLGRKLKPGEVVHHKNGVRDDNRPENLEIHKSHAEHMREHMTPAEARKRGANGNVTRRRLAALKVVGHGR